MSTIQHQVTIASRQYTFYTLQAFEATKHAMQLKKIIERGMGQGLDSNIIQVISTVDEKTLEEVIFPILSKCAVTCITEEKKLQSSRDMNEIYTVEDMDEFFLVVWEVLKANFGPFFRKMAKNLFGFDLDQLDPEKIRSMLKAAVEKAKTDPTAK